MTSLIDVIFLLLLFFMLTSSFSKFSDVELVAASSGGQGTVDTTPLFLQLLPECIRLNGTQTVLAALEASDLVSVEPGTVILVSLDEGVTAQRLTDLLVVLRRFPDLAVTVLGA